MVNSKSTPILINYRALRKRLKLEYGYNEQQVMHTLWRLMNAVDPVKEAFGQWYLEGKDPQLECEGISWYDMVEKKGLNPFNAFLFMDTLIRDPRLGVNLLPEQLRPSLQISVDKLRPELRKYVEEQRKKEAEKETFHPKDGDEIDINQTPKE